MTEVREGRPEVCDKIESPCELHRASSAVAGKWWEWRGARSKFKGILEWMNSPAHTTLCRNMEDAKEGLLGFECHALKGFRC